MRDSGNTMRHGVLLVGAVGLLAGTLACLRGTADELSAATPQQIFERRIMPIFKSPNPSSCTQCHLAGVDLKNYILPSHEKTFLSLRDQGLIDLDRPERSHILHLIAMGADDRRGAALIQQKVRRAEYDAFAEWIKACCRDPKLRDAPPLPATERAQPPRPPEVIRHDRKDHLLASFERNVWAMRFRCMSCHIEGTPDNDKLRKEHGDRVAWIKAAGAEATMNYLLASRLLNKAEPEKSLLLLKPLGAVKHGGGKKFLPGDLGYKAFRAWLDDYARTVGDKYETAADLPPEQGQPDRFGTDAWLKIANTPPAWGDRLLQATLYAWDAERNAWETEPIAVSDRGVWGKGRLWQHNLTLLAAPGSERARQWHRGRPALSPGRYLVKVHVDFRGRLAHDWQATLGDADYAGAAEITSRWPTGYGNMTVLDAGQVRR